MGRAVAMAQRVQGRHQRHLAGFTLIELVMVVALLGIMSAVAIPVIGSFLASSKETATREEMQRLARAIAGSDNPNDRGFEGDVGFAPSDLADLTAKPGSIAVWDAFLDVGWNGPYMDSTDGEYLTDAWGQSYSYDPAGRTIESTGGPDTITIGF
jgi:prepilin-type N-terminal cleavage/methylation domain-containing protein